MAHTAHPPGQSIEALVLDTLAATCRCERDALFADTALLDLNLDSLSLMALVTRVEAAFGVTFDADDTVHLLGAGSVGELCRAIGKKCAQQRNLHEDAGYRACAAGDSRD